MNPNDTPSDGFLAGLFLGATITLLPVRIWLLQEAR